VGEKAFHIIDSQMLVAMKSENQASNDKLDDKENADTSAKVRWLSIETRDDVDNSLTEGEEDSEELLSGLVELAIGLQVQVDINQVGASKELEDHSR
jgi:hypothetical protein